MEGGGWRVEGGGWRVEGARSRAYVDADNGVDEGDDDHCTGIVISWSTGMVISVPVYYSN